MHCKLNYSLSEFGKAFFALKVFIFKLNLDDIHSNSSEVQVWRVGPESETAEKTTLGNQGTSETSEKKTVASALQLFAVRAS